MDPMGVTTADRAFSEALARSWIEELLDEVLGGFGGVGSVVASGSAGFDTAVDGPGPFQQLGNGEPACPRMSSTTSLLLPFPSSGDVQPLVKSSVHVGRGEIATAEECCKGAARRLLAVTLGGGGVHVAAGRCSCTSTQPASRLGVRICSSRAAGAVPSGAASRAPVSHMSHSSAGCSAFAHKRLS